MATGETFLILDTIGDPGEQRQRDLSSALGLPLFLVQDRWHVIDLTTMTVLPYASGERYIPPEAVYQDQLEKVEQVLQLHGECLAGMPTILIFDEGVEGCHAINAGFALAVYLQTATPPRLIGIKQSGALGIWLMSNSISFSPEHVALWRQAALVPIPMGIGQEMLLSEVLSTYLLTQKRKGISDISVGTMGVTLLVALEQYRQSRNLDAFAQTLGIPAEIVASYRSMYDRRRAIKKA